MAALSAQTMGGQSDDGLAMAVTAKNSDAARGILR